METVDMEKGGLEQPKESNENTHTSDESGLHIRPVNPDEIGEGLPYAPINWPNPGDNWGWRVGKRVAAQGHYLDRYLYPPKRLWMRKKGFASKLAVVRFIKENIPGADTESFFASFSWKIPAPVGNIEGSSVVTVEKINEVSAPESESPSDGVSCKAGNKTCSSLVIKPADQILSAIPMPCDICCSEPRFCRDCCCILCCKPINTDFGGYSYLKCEATKEDNQICGHVAHLNCALRSYMAGTVGGSVNLDAEYYCRRCDAKKDLISHVIRLLQICESIDSREDIEKILNVGVCILRGSKKTSAKRLLNRIECSIIKLKCGTSPEEIWYAEQDGVENITGVMNNTSDEMEVTNQQDSKYDESNLLPDLTQFSDCRNEYEKAEYKSDQALLDLRKSQDTEFKIAEDVIHIQKTYLKNLFQQLNNELAELARNLPNTNPTLMNTVVDRLEQVRRENKKLKEMCKIGNGFGKMSKAFLKQQFGMKVDE